MTQERKLLANNISSLILQILTVISGFILPRLILAQYGSELNGLTHSIAQFLSVIAFLELGVGTVVQSALYKPLAENDAERIDLIISSAHKFFRTLAIVFACYVAGLIFLYPMFVKTEFSYWYVAALVALLALHSFSQYYFAIVDRLLLLADQRGYVFFILQAVTTVVYTAVTAVLIVLGVNFLVVRIIAVVLFLVWPVFNKIYVKKRYHVNRRVKFTEEPIGQKWNGIAQHVAAFVLDGTDVIVLTVISGVSCVSVYSVYNMIVTGIRQVLLATTSGLSAFWGRLFADNETERLREDFSYREWKVHTAVLVLFGCTTILIVPFVQIYTKGITDADYIQPWFAYILTAAQAFRCIRLPYNVLILSGNHYKQTQRSYLIAAALNIVISICLVFKFGLIGVAVGTAVAMLYQTVWMAVYDYRVFLKRPFGLFIKQFGVDIATAAVACLLCARLPLLAVNYGAWLVLAIETFFIWLAVVAVVNLLLYRGNVKKLFAGLCRKQPV